MPAPRLADRPQGYARRGTSLRCCFSESVAPGAGQRRQDGRARAPSACRSPSFAPWLGPRLALFIRPADEQEPEQEPVQVTQLARAVPADTGAPMGSGEWLRVGTTVPPLGARQGAFGCQLDHPACPGLR